MIGNIEKEERKKEGRTRKYSKAVDSDRPMGSFASSSKVTVLYYTRRNIGKFQLRLSPPRIIMLYVPNLVSSEARIDNVQYKRLETG